MDVLVHFNQVNSYGFNFKYIRIQLKSIQEGHTMMMMMRIVIKTMNWWHLKSMRNLSQLYLTTIFHEIGNNFERINSHTLRDMHVEWGIMRLKWFEKDGRLLIKVVITIWWNVLVILSRLFVH